MSTVKEEWPGNAPETKVFGHDVDSKTHVKQGNGEKGSQAKLTHKEKTLYSILAAPLHQVCSSYEPSPFEFLPSRFLAFLPHPFMPCSSFAATSLMDMVSHPEFLSETTSLGASEKSEVPPSMPESHSASRYTMGVVDSSVGSPHRNSSLTQGIMDTFSDFSKLSDEEILKLCRKGPEISVTKSIDIYSDDDLRGNEYAIASSSINTIKPGSFVIASTSGNQSILYSPIKQPSAASHSTESVDGMPTDFVTIQMTTATAPKHWFCLRQTHAGSKKGFVTEVSGKRVSIQHDTSTSMSEMAHPPITLKARHPGVEATLR